MFAGPSVKAGVVVGIIVAAQLVACGDSTGGPGRCTPGQAVECLCSAEQGGVQTCNAAGTFDACSCEPPPDANGSDTDPTVDADSDAGTDAGNDDADAADAVDDSGDADGDAARDVAEDGEPDADGGGDAAADALPDALPDAVSETVVLPAAGGEVDVLGVRFLVPAGAVPVDTAISVRCSSDATRPGYALYSPVCSFEPDGLVFASPVTVAIPFVGDAQRAAMFWSRPTSEGGGYERLGGRVTSDVVEAEVTHFSEGFVADGVAYEEAVDPSCVRTQPLDVRVADDGTSTVAVFFGVQDCQGRPITGLGMGDFEVREDGARLSSEASAVIVPTEGRQVFVTLSLDMSASTASVVDTVVDAANAFVDQLVADDLPVHISVEIFAGMASPQVWLPHTVDLEQVRGTLDALRTYTPPDVSSTNLHGAIVAGIDHLVDARGALEDRNLGGALTTGFLVVFTDGGDTAGYLSAEAARAAAAGAADQLMVVGLSGADYDAAAIAALNPDRVLTASEPGALRRELGAMANRIAGQVDGTYLLGYCSPKRSGTHTVAVAAVGAAEGESLSATFSASGFGPGCSSTYFAERCTGDACGGMACGVCDDRSTACTPQGDDFVCLDLCEVLDDCSDEPFVTPLGYTLTCASSLERTECGSQCIDTTADPTNCGGCGIFCTGLATCEAGECVCPGDDPRFCSGRCIDVASSFAHCGDCGVQCANAGACEAGVCTCPGEDGRDCGGYCRDVAVDPNHCGACGFDCGFNATGCAAGVCMCEPGWRGARCETPICADGCGPRSTCIAPNLCGCDLGFAGPSCDIAVAAGFAFVTVQPGTFSMGSPTTEMGRFTNEWQHSVTLTRRFLMQTTEVTQAQWTALSGGVNPSCFQSTSGIRCATGSSNPLGPVERVDWYSAMAFANALSVREGLQACYTLVGCADPANGWQDGEHTRCTEAIFSGLDCTGYRLPTEAEWEYAARAGTTTATYAGDLSSEECEDTTLPPIAWYACSTPEYRTQPIGTKIPNAWGLFDMLGNVNEWVFDAYRSYTGAVTDPVITSAGEVRVARGGGYVASPRELRAARRADYYSSTLRDVALGFRLARTLP